MLRSSDLWFWLGLACCFAQVALLIGWVLLLLFAPHLFGGHSPLARSIASDYDGSDRDVGASSVM